jgi:methyl-accepting chemotaxis protein
MIRALKEKLQGSMGLKFVLAVTLVIAVLMVAGTLFVARMLQESQYRTLEIRGRELGLFLGKTVVDPLLFKDSMQIDGLVSEAARAQDVIYTFVTDASGEIVSSAEASFQTDDPAVAKFLDQEKTNDMKALVERAKPAFDVLEVPVSIKMEQSVIGQVVVGFSRQSVKREAGKVVALLLATSVAIVALLAALVYAMVRRMIVRPTSEAVAAASSIAAGDLTRSVRVESADELGMLGRGINRMVIGLKEIIGTVVQATQNVGGVSSRVKNISDKMAGGSKEQSEAVEEAASSVNEMHFSLKEIAESVETLSRHSEHTSSSVLELAASVDEVARTTSDLSTSIDETSSTIDQMSVSIRQIAEHLETLSAAVEETSASATEISASVREVESNARESASLAEAVAADGQQLGMKSIEKTIDGMGRIETAAHRTGDVVNRLGERAESIGSILTVIEDITDQTALLALNASILAAQAGEHGKGFGVVASEIRELANRTAASTKEIAAVIGTVQDEAREAVAAMRESSEFVAQGVRLSNDAGDALKKIVERADQSRDMSKNISRAAAEQTRGMKQVSDAIDKINDMAHQISRATQEQRTGSVQISRAAEKMREMTRLVKNATAEQSKGGKDISSAVEDMNVKIGLVFRASGEVRSGSDLIVRAIDRIKNIVRNNADMAEELNSAVDTLATQADDLKRNTQKFKT